MDPHNVGGKYTGSDIWVSHYDPAKSIWSKPSNAHEVFNNKGHSAVVGINEQGDIIYQLNTAGSKKTPGIFRSCRTNGSWTEPELIPVPNLDTDEFLGLYVSPDLSTIIISMKDAESRGLEDLYVSRREGDGEWSKPLNLGSSINTPGFEISPFLTADKKRLYFASNGHPGQGDADIFYSERLSDSWENWSTPVNLGAGVNSNKFDAYFTVRDSLAYFCSNRDGRFADLFRASRQGTVDSTQQRIDKLVAEAQTILDDLSDAPADSVHLLTPASRFFVLFDDQSANLNQAATGQLTGLINTMKKRQSTIITLIAYIAYANNFPANDQDTNVWYKRMEAIKQFLEGHSIPGLRINYELKKQPVKESAITANAVEVSYQP
jgi:hypothetical protein